MLVLGRSILQAAVAPSPTLLNGLIAYWKLDEATGAQRNDSIGSNHMADFFSATQETGILTSAAGFDAASTQYLFHADAPELRFGDSSWSWTLWYKPLDTITQIMIGKDNGVGNPRDGFVGVLSGVSAVCSAYYGPGTTDVLSAQLASVFSIGSWGFMVAWHDAVARTLNVQVDNGSIGSTSTAAQTLQTSNAGLFFGRRSSAPERFCTGHLDGVGKWNRVLTAAERTQLYNSGAGLDYPFS